MKGVREARLYANMQAILQLFWGDEGELTRYIPKFNRESKLAFC
jgi:hypothetical protein